MRNDVQFIQSQNDFPLTVNLGKKNPTWGLNRWNGQGLRFIPFDDEGFSLRGDKRQLVYKGRKRSHRFTIHSDTLFEYDCILEKEPESNVVSLLMEGAEQYDFFKQPDFVPDPFLKGSFAVYKKETLLNQGTGKLCHIHRPLIIDARGRKCWGDLSVVGNELRITIPEQWLAEAKYPVVVDPTVGSEQLGSHELFSGFIDGWNRPVLINDLGLNRYLLGQELTGTCTFRVYAFWTSNQELLEPCVYTDNNNSPHQKRSDLNFMANVRVNSSLLQPGWRTSTFWIDGRLNAGSFIWFGAKSGLFSSRFDYVSNPMLRYQFSASVPYAPSLLPAGNARLTLDVRFSWYFTYSAGQNYIRTLTQGLRLTDTRAVKRDLRRTATQTVRLTDTRALKRDIRRTTTQTVRGSARLSRFETFVRRCFDNVRSNTRIVRLNVFIRFVIDQIRITDVTNNKRDINRNFRETATAGSVTKKAQSFLRELKGNQNVSITDRRELKAEYKRLTVQTVRGTDSIKSFVSFIRRCFDNIRNNMSLARLPIFSRSIADQSEISDGTSNKREINRKCNETAVISSETKKVQAFLRDLKDSQNVIDKQELKGEYKRSTIQTVHGTTEINAFVFFFRQCLLTVASITNLNRISTLLRSFIDHAVTADDLKSSRELIKKFEEKMSVKSEVKRSQGFYRRVYDSLTGTDSTYYPVVFIRSISEKQSIADAIQKWGAYIRGLYVEAGSLAETVRWGDFYRKESDTVQAEGSLFRHLFVFIRILTTSLVRDYIIRRFLVAREELVLKSCVTRELILDNKIS